MLNFGSVKGKLVKGPFLTNIYLETVPSNFLSTAVYKYKVCPYDRYKRSYLTPINGRK